MAKILYHPKSAVTGKELAIALEIESGVECNTRVDKLIRWGSRVRIPRIPGNVLNHRDILDRCSDKGNALAILHNAGIRIPPIANRFDGKLLVGRTSNHMQGSGFYLITSSRDFELAQHLGCSHFMEYIPCKREYRIHVFGNEVISMSEKRMSNDATSLTIRNYETGWKFKYIDSANEDIKQIALDAISTAGFDFGAVDIIESMTGIPYVLELNSAPGLCRVGDDEVMQRYPAFEKYVDKFRGFLNG